MVRERRVNRVLSVVFTILSLAWVYPMFMIFVNSFKQENAINTTSVFELLNAGNFDGIANYVNALTRQGFASAFGYSLLITVT